MEITTLIIIGLSSSTLFFLWKWLGQRADAIDAENDSVDEINDMLDVFNNLEERMHASLTTMREMDTIGAYETNDELQFFFEYCKDSLNDLNTFFEEFDIKHINNENEEE